MEIKRRLPKEFTLKWLEALRGGEYKQCSSDLYYKPNDSYCCLGVASHLSGDDFNKADLNKTHTFNICRVFPNSKVPKELTEDLSKNSIARILAEKNDSGQTFTQIADWIEENIELY